LTLRRLVIDAPSSYDLHLAHFPSLTHLSLGLSAPRFESVLGALLPGNRLEYLRLVLYIVPGHNRVQDYGMVALNRLFRVLPPANLPALECLELNVPSRALGPDARVLVETAFADWDGGRVRVVMR